MRTLPTPLPGGTRYRPDRADRLVDLPRLHGRASPHPQLSTAAHTAPFATRGTTMPDKSPQRPSDKKQGKSLKEKREAKREKKSSKQGLTG